MRNNSNFIKENLERRTFGEHLTSKDIFLKCIFPEIKENLHEYIWVDFFAGEGNLILPILNNIPKQKRIDFFENHIYLFDVQEKMVEMCVKNAELYGIPTKLAKDRIKARDNLETFPEFLKVKDFPLFHVTNPPYLYLGYIRKHKETQKYLKYFQGANNGYQDLYQIAMINDLRNEVKNLIYIIPTNFIFGASVSNKFRIDFLKYYNISKMILFETKEFEFTGQNICIGFFKRKNSSEGDIVNFKALKIKQNNELLDKLFVLKRKYKYRGGTQFFEFLDEYKTKKPLNVKYYLLSEEVTKNKGTNQISVIDSNNYANNEYKRIPISVNNNLREKIENNILYVQTVDKGSSEGRVGLGIIAQDFKVKGIFVSSSPYRTHPIQIFLTPQISKEEQILLKDYFNFILEHFRKELDSEFLTTYKYSKAEYTRKYLGLTQVRNLIETLPITNMDKLSKENLKEAIFNGDFKKILNIINENK